MKEKRRSPIPASPEQPTEEMLLDPSVIKPFAQGLRRAFTPPLSAINRNLVAIEISPALQQDPDIEPYILQVRPDYFSVTDFLLELERSHEVRVVEDSGTYRIEFSSEKDPVQTVLPVTKRMKREVSQPFILALTAHIIDPLTELIGYSDILRAFGSKRKGLNERLTAIIESSKNAAKIVTNLQNADEIEIVTSDQGEIALNPVHFS